MPSIEFGGFLGLLRVEATRLVRRVAFLCGVCWIKDVKTLFHKAELKWGQIDVRS